MGPAQLRLEFGYPARRPSLGRDLGRATDGPQRPYSRRDLAKRQGEEGHGSPRTTRDFAPDASAHGMSVFSGAAIRLLSGAWICSASDRSLDPRLLACSASDGRSLSVREASRFVNDTWLDASLVEGAVGPLGAGWPVAGLSRAWCHGAR